MGGDDALQPRAGGDVAAGAPAFPRDEHGIHGSRALIDATIPFGDWDHYERRVPPGGAPLLLEEWLH